MGQQQLLLVILVTVIVGIATVVAINTFGSAADNANVDAVRNDIASIASSAQGYLMKPTMMGGGGGSFETIEWSDMSGVSCTRANAENDAGENITVCENENGSYTLTPSADNVVVTGTPNQAGGTVTATIVPDGVTDAGIEYDPSGGSD